MKGNQKDLDVDNRLLSKDMSRLIQSRNCKNKIILRFFI